MRTCLRAALLPLLAFSLLFTSVSAAQAAPEDSGNPGKVRFVKRMDSGFDPFIATNANSAWINQKFWRMEVFDPHFVNVGAVSWYTKGWAYFNSHGFWPDDTSRLQWGLKSPSGELAYINWGCEDGACDRRAGDITNPDFRKNYVDELKLLMTRGYIGAWIDDVNMNLDLTNRAGAPIQVYSPSLGRVMTSEDWRKAMATFMEEIRAAIPNKEILHNSPWGAGRDWTSGANYANWFPEIDRQIKAADYINREGGFASDGGLRGGNAEWSIRAVHRYADKVHANGAGIIIDDFVPSAVGREYTLANYLLVSNGRDGVGEMSQTPQNWWSGWETDLGQASGPRYEWQGLIRRDFAGGMALVREPESSTTGAIPLPAPMKKLDGTTVSTVTLSASQGIVLKTATQVAAPTISSLSPTKGFFDVATPVTITGANLSGASVTVDGAAVTPSATSATSISITVPAAGAAGAVPIRVTTAGGSATATFTREARPAAPTISSLSPTKGLFDVATPVTITGANLSGASVTVNGSAVTPSANTATSVSLTVPAGSATGSIPIRVATAGGSATVSFTREARPPTISSMTPTKGFFDAATPVTITGTYLTGASVTVNGSTVAPTLNSATSLSFTVPAGSAPGTPPIVVTTAGGSVSTTFTREARPPAISSMTPTKGFFDVATPVTITGTYLTGALVTVNGSPATPTSVSATSVSLTVPAGTAPGSVPINVTTAGGSATTTFTREARPVTSVPAITSISRTIVNNKYLANIRGTGFTGATRVDFGTVASTSVTVISDTQITAAVPLQPAGTVNVRVTTPGGTSPVVAAGTWLYLGPPKITGITPSSGPAAGGGIVTVLGSALNNASVRVGTVIPTGVVNYGNEIDFTAPAGTGTQTVTVITPEGTATTSYTYVAAPTIASLSVTKGYVDVATPLELKGTNLIGTTVKVNGTTVLPSKITPTSMVLTVPKGTAAGNATIAVTGPGGTATTTFAYITRSSTAPTITGINPTSWYWNIATQVTISGTNLSAATLQVNGTTVTPKSRTATAVTVLLPVGSAPGTVATITLSTTAGTATTLYNWAPYLATSVAPNGTFEAGIGSWTAGSGVTMTSATDQKRSGTRSLKYVSTGAGMPVESLATSGMAGRYQVGGWAMVPAGVEWSLDLTDSTGAVHARASAVGTGGWQYVSVVGVTASTRPGVKFRTASGATAWLDDVTVQAAT
ncbi:MAG: IPT/TIG domain-containing protein [Solirubrobacteraceae bacterium]|nr:IPT/TIG domain-containing protein [Solirubrobacteraceae bacterium]